MTAEGVDPTTYAVASNALAFGDSGTLVRVDPEEPVTSNNKASTYARNRHGFFQQHSARCTLLLIGDKLSDVRMADGALADGYSCYSVGVHNASPDGLEYPDQAAYAAAFDALVNGDDASLDPLSSMIESLALAAAPPRDEDAYM